MFPGIKYSEMVKWWKWLSYHIYYRNKQVVHSFTFNTIPKIYYLYF